MKRVLRPFSTLSTASLLIAGYCGVSIFGGFLLWLPPFHRGALSFVDALFTAVSAVCVTGLIVVDTPRVYTVPGQFVIMALIQVGGLGYMTAAALFMSILGTRSPLYARKMMISTLGVAGHGEIVRFARQVCIAATLIELVFVVPLWIVFARAHGAMAGLWHAVFHSVSALNNAGFSTFPDSLMSYRGSAVVNLSVLGLIVIGGIGFKVWRDLKHLVLDRRRLDLHDRLVLASTAVLIVVPCALFYWLEDSFAGFGSGERFWASLFASVSPRTAGFNTVSYAQMSTDGLLMTMSLMFIGGSPGGTAGGVKTATAVIVLLWMVAELRGRRSVSAFHRTIPQETVTRAIETVTIAAMLIWFTVMALCFTERGLGHPNLLQSVAFEVCSAYGTVGLSTGSARVAEVSLVGDFTAAGKLIVAGAMVAGRAGYLIFAASLIRTARQQYRYAKGEVLL